MLTDDNYTPNEHSTWNYKTHRYKGFNNPHIHINQQLVIATK
jgi:hypothetical protein